MAQRFRDALMEHINSSDLSIPELARRAGVSKHMLFKLKQGRSASTNVDDAISLAKVFGKSVNEFVDDTPDSRLAELQRLFALLSEQEQDLLAAQIRGLIEHQGKAEK